METVTYIVDQDCPSVPFTMLYRVLDGMLTSLIWNPAKLVSVADTAGNGVTG